MKLHRSTTSLCNVCYKEIPAVVSIEPDGVYMRKECSEHGKQVGLLERDALFYSMIAGLAAKTIYRGYFVDVSRRCQLRCNHCYYRLEKDEPEGLFSKERILQECRVNAHLAPIIFIGGEPTLHPDIVELCQRVNEFAPVGITTNGVKLADPGFFNPMVKALTRPPDPETGIAMTNINLSLHLTESDDWKLVIEHCRRQGVILESVLITINSREEFEQAVHICEELSDCVLGFRIHAASKLWAEENVSLSSYEGAQPIKKEQKIFGSDMCRWLEEMGMDPHLQTEWPNKSVFLNVSAQFGSRRLLFMLAAWNDVTNVDLRDIDCPPYYRARNGGIYNLVTAQLVNEGIEKGYVAGMALPTRPYRSLMEAYADHGPSKAEQNHQNRESIVAAVFEPLPRTPAPA